MRKFSQDHIPGLGRIFRDSIELLVTQVGERLALRDKLKCHTFQWYLDNVWPEHIFPTAGRKIGKLRNEGAPGLCLQKPFRSPTGTGNQGWKKRFKRLGHFWA